MKELSIEEKAKAYDEALKEAVVAHKDEDKHLKATLERIFPQLKESEDEKIRKELLEHCKNQAKLYVQTGNKCPQIQSWIAWLEKQGELVNSLSKGLDNAHERIDGLIQKNNSLIEQLEKQGEQKLADKVEPKFKVGDTIDGTEVTTKVFEGVPIRANEITSYRGKLFDGVSVVTSSSLGFTADPDWHGTNEYTF